MQKTATVIENSSPCTPSLDRKNTTKTVAIFAAAQVLVQGVTFLSGLIIIHALNRNEYAFYTIASTMQGTLTVLANLGVHSALSALGGNIWQDRTRLAQLVRAALNVRRQISVGASIIMAAVTWWMLRRQGCDILSTLILCALIISSVQYQITASVYVVIPQLYSRVNILRNLDICCSLLRLVMLGIAYPFKVNAVLVVAITGASFYLQSELIKRAAASDIKIYAHSSREDEKEIWRVVREQAPSGIYFAFQGQVSMFLISIFGNTGTIADIGALGRLALIFAVIASVMINFVAPRFARYQDILSVKKMYWQIVSVFAVVSIAFAIIALLFPNAFLFLLGSKYSHLHHILPYMIISSLINNLTGVFVTLNSAKAWLKLSWLSIPITILFQLATLPWLDLRNPAHVIIFGSLPAIPTWFVYMYEATKNMQGLTRPSLDKGSV